MPVTLNDSRPIGLCVATEELFDTKRFLVNYCDGLILREQDQLLKNRLISVKRELNSFRSQDKFFDGYKAIIVNNMDKIIGLVSSRYSNMWINETDQIVNGCKNLISKTLRAKNFDDISKLGADFRSNVTLPTYKLFITNVKKPKDSIA